MAPAVPTVPAVPVPECAGLTEQVCEGQCVDTAREVADCGCCACSCETGRRCHRATCEPQLTCEPRTSQYDTASLLLLAPSDSDDPKEVELAAGGSFTLPGAVQSGPAVVHVVARGDASQPWPTLTVQLGVESGPGLVVRTARAASYRFEVTGDGASELVVGSPESSAPAGFGKVFIERIDVEHCNELHGVCSGGGMFVLEAQACAPFVCEAARDCSDAFSRPTFGGECVDGQCVYPECVLVVEPVTGEIVAPDENLGDLRCFNARELADPRRNPTLPESLAPTATFACPDVTELSWVVERFRGEGSCVEWPVCGPSPPAALGLANTERPCCYAIGRLCGV
jgi:hypothetical protein